MWFEPRPTTIPNGILIHPTVWPEYTNVTQRQTDRQDRQRSDSIGSTVLQTVAQKLTRGQQLWTNGWMYQDETLHAGRTQPWSHCARWGPSSPSPKNGAQPPIFGPYLLWPNGWMDQDATWQGGKPQPKRHCVRWGPISPSQKGGGAPNFLAHICCGQTVYSRYGRKIGGAPPPFRGGKAGCPSNTMWPAPMPICVPIFILIHPTGWPLYTNVTDRTDSQTENGLIEIRIGRTVFTARRNARIAAAMLALQALC